MGPQEVVDAADHERVNAASAALVHNSPVAARMITAGTHTSAPPTPGMIDSTVMTVPQKTGPSIPATQNARPPRNPCAAPMRIVPLSVARVTETNFSSIRCLSMSASGTYARTPLRSFGPPVRKKYIA